MNKCLACGKPTKNIKFCNHKCQKFLRRKKLKNKFLKGSHKNKPIFFRTGEWTRELVIDTYGEKCAACNMGPKWKGKSIVLEVNHINGRAHNNVIENLEFLCPNCHSQTDTHRAKNMGKGDRKYLSFR